MIITPLSALLLFPAMLLCLEAGRRLRRTGVADRGNAAIEGAIFGLVSLLLAFTFSGAVARLDAHRVLLTEEANDIGTAYMRLDLLPVAARPELRELFRKYATSRLHLFDTIGSEASAETLRLQGVIWEKSIEAAASNGANHDAMRLLLPSLNSMFDISFSRRNAFSMHPPVIVFLLLFGFSCCGAFMAGYGRTGPSRDWIQALILAATVTLTIYGTLEIEYPRRGLIRWADLDQRLIEQRDLMK